MTPTDTPQPVVVFVTALELEADAVVGQLLDGHVDWFPERGGTQYRVGTWKGSKTVWKVIVAEMGKGEEDAAAGTVLVLYRFSPALAFFAGIAGGLREVAIGDVVVANEVFGFDYGSAERSFHPQGLVGQSSYSLVQLAKRVRTDRHWQRRAGPTADGCNARVGAIASGNKLIANSKSPSALLIRNAYSSTVAVDMESLGFLRGSRMLANDVLVVRGISDLLDDKDQADRGGSRQRAASHASAFCFEVLELIEPGPQTVIATNPHVDSTSPSVDTEAVPHRDTYAQSKSGSSLMTRVNGQSGITTTIDLVGRRVVASRSDGVIRQSGIFLRSKDPRDAHFITGRLTGISGDNNSTCSAYTQNMLNGARPPPLGEYITNLGEAAEYMFDHNIFQENLVGVDFCENTIAETNPGLLNLANRTESPHAADHGRKYIGDIMRSLNPFSGDLYRESLAVSRWTREMSMIMLGRHVHPSTVYPGGTSTTATVQLFTDYYVRLMRYCEYMKHVVPLHDDLFNFFYCANPEYEGVGRRRILLGCWGAFQDPLVCNFKYRDITNWGRAMGVTPGVVVDGKLVSSDLGTINLGIRLVPSAATDDEPDGNELLVARDPLGYQVDRHHPWNEFRQESPSKGTAGTTTRSVEVPRWFNGRELLALELGPIARLWSTALSGLVDVGYVTATGTSVLINLPKTAGKGEVCFEWECPKWCNALERNRARTYFQAFAAASALDNIDKALAEVRAGHTETWKPFNVAEDSIGCGFTESVRGGLSHHATIRRGKIANYYVLSPTQWNASPRDRFGTPGPCEDALRDTALLEDKDLGNIYGIDITRTIRSFDFDVTGFVPST